MPQLFVRELHTLHSNYKYIKGVPKEHSKIEPVLPLRISELFIWVPKELGVIQQMINRISCEPIKNSRSAIESLYMSEISKHRWYHSPILLLVMLYQFSLYHGVQYTIGGPDMHRIYAHGVVWSDFVAEESPVLEA